MKENTEKSARLSFNEDFSIEIHRGLSSFPKYISSKFFYDEKGDKLFEQIMQLDEYYLTRCEFEIFNKQKTQIFDSLPFKDLEFDLVELGSGDGSKTKILIREIMENNPRIHYFPIDISGSSLENLRANMSELFPIQIKTFNYPYLEGIDEVYKHSPERPKLILFLGSNIGNLSQDKAAEFLSELKTYMNKGDILFLGLDLKKDPKVILNAYNDSKGVTAEFNLNVLDRINNELGANFNRNNFYHYPVYDPETGSAKSYLVSKHWQEVYLESTGEKYVFEKGEPVFTEISQKYSLTEVTQLAERSGLKVISSFRDSKEFFADILLEK